MSCTHEHSQPRIVEIRATAAGAAGAATDSASRCLSRRRFAPTSGSIYSSIDPSIYLFIYLGVSKNLSGGASWRGLGGALAGTCTISNIAHCDYDDGDDDYDDLFRWSVRTMMLLGNQPPNRQPLTQTNYPWRGPGGERNGGVAGKYGFSISGHGLYTIICIYRNIISL